MAHFLTSAIAIRDKIMSLLMDQISRFEFQDWLAGAMWNIEQPADPDAADPSPLLDHRHGGACSAGCSAASWAASSVCGRPPRR